MWTPQTSKLCLILSWGGGVIPTPLTESWDVTAKALQKSTLKRPKFQTF